MKIDFRTIPHCHQRYETVGDYYEKDGILYFRVSEMEDWRYEFLVFFHELIEWALVKFFNVPLAVIDDFDIQFEEERSRGLHGKYEEPGNDPKAPYHRYHRIAHWFERSLAFFLKVNWKVYGYAVDNLQ